MLEKTDMASVLKYLAKWYTNLLSPSQPVQPAEKPVERRKAYNSYIG